MSSIAESKSLFEIDTELDDLLDDIQEEIECEGQASTDRLNRFQGFCKAHSEKVDRIGRFCTDDGSAYPALPERGKSFAQTSA